MPRSLAALLFHCFLGKGADGLVLGVLGPWVELGDLLLAAMCADLDFRKNFDSTLQQRLGHPIVAIPEIHPQMANVSFRFGATMGKADVGLATALDMVLGLDGEEPIVGLIGPAISSVAMPMATTAAVQQIPQISFSATSPLLSNKDAYPYFLRTVPPDTVQAIVLWQFLSE
ncbi:Grm5 [Symbiodinium microadriaticum]|nr:Grm5 [Symbiodinium microadriaticum]